MSDVDTWRGSVIKLRAIPLLIMLASLPTAMAQTAAKDASTTAPAASEYSVWETVSRIDRYGRTDTQPAKSDRRVIQECIRSQDMSAKAIARRDASSSALAARCWITQEREEDTRSQVKWACKDGTTFEIAARRETDARLGYQMVVNVPGEGALSIRAESMRVADTCIPPPADAQPSQPVAPAAPAAPAKPSAKTPPTSTPQKAAPAAPKP